MCSNSNATERNILLSLGGILVGFFKYEIMFFSIIDSSIRNYC